MGTGDISRSRYARDKRYTAVHMEQGRVLTDADFNVATDLDLEDDRLTRLGVIGPYGSSDNGFRITNPVITAEGHIDFEIGAGTLHLGGHRIERMVGETFELQSDWLNNPGRPAPGAGTRFDLAYLTVSLQPVSAVEDGEQLEPALGGPDTTTLLRPVARVQLAEGMRSGTCHEAWDELEDRWGTAGLGIVDDEMRVMPDTSFTLSFAPGSGGDDLCSPEVLGGYLGADNRTIRIMLLGGGRFIWGFDNVHPLYRVRLEDGGTTLRFLTEPKDVHHWPAAGQTIEVLPWGQVLSNGEKLADEEQPGHFGLVEEAFDPDERTLRLTAGTAVPAAFGTEWQSRSDEAALRRTRYGLEGPIEPYYFARVWDRGPDVTAEPTLPLAPAPVALGTTGLRLDVTGADARPGDFAIAAARPATPDRVLPWELLVGRAPHGVHRFAAPLAVIRWDGAVGTVLQDCRPRFRPLTRIRTCCSFSVGDGEISHGDFDRVQDAIDALPPQGGEVCVLPGRYEERLDLDHLDNVKISGCGDRSVIVAPDLDTAPLMTISGGSGIRLTRLKLVSLTGPALQAAGDFDGSSSVPIEDLTLEALDVSVRDTSGIDVREVRRFEMLRCRVGAEELEESLETGSAIGRRPAVFLLGEDILVAESHIVSVSDRAIRRALGGLQIGGGSERVRVRNNVIRGGNGNGITLGHVYLADRETAGHFKVEYGEAAARAETYSVGDSIRIDENGCIEIDPPDEDSPGDPDGPRRVPVSGGDLEDVRIRENDISRMGLSGIGMPLAFRRGRPVLVAVTRLEIETNQIRGCATLRVPEFPTEVGLYVAFGGIALAVAALASITDNFIEGNGRSHLQPICGIRVVLAETLVIADNRIIDNGPRTETDRTPRSGVRGGIVILATSPHATAQASAEEFESIVRLTPGFAAARAVGLPALMIHDNLVQQPSGKALIVFGFGHVSVVANHLASQGTTTRGSFREALQEMLTSASDLSPEAIEFLMIDRVMAGAVSIVNSGFSSERAEGASFVKLADTGLFGEDAPGPVLNDVERTGEAEALPARGWQGKAALFRNGEVLFNDNVVVQSFLDGQRSLTMAVVVLNTMDDLSISGNSFSTQVDFMGDFTMSTLMALGWSIRCTSNRFEETLLRTYVSALTIGFYNSTVHNQGTHCFSVAGHPALLTDAPNHSLIKLLSPFACGECLKPPFAGVDMVARDADGRVVEPSIETSRGVRGLFFHDTLEIDLGVTVKDATVGVITKEGDVSVEAHTSSGVISRIAGPVEGETLVEFEAPGIHSIILKDGKKQALLTRLCTGRPQLGSGDATNPKAMRIGEFGDG